MELYQLRTFLVIARTLNLTRAAAELHASQPTVSGQLKALEQELGVTLFERTARGMNLTETGKRLRDKAQEITDRAAEFTQLAMALAENSPTRCRVGLNTTATSLRIPQLVAALAELAPRLRLELHQDQSHTILQDVARGELDAGFFFGRCERGELTCSKLAEVELAVVGPKDWEGSLRDASWEALLAKPWVLPPEICPFYAKTRELLLPLDHWPSNCVVADDEATTLDLVRAEAGVALLPTSMLEGEKGVAVLRHGATAVDLALAWQTRRTESTELQLLLRALERLWQRTLQG